MMPVKWKFFLILILSIFTTAGAGVYIAQQQSVSLVETSDSQQQQFSTVQQSQEIVEYRERSHYKTIPLESITSSLQGSDPATLALNALEDQVTYAVKRKVEVDYPQRNQAFVTITQIQPNRNSQEVIKYRVEMTTFGRSLFS